MESVSIVIPCVSSNAGPVRVTTPDVAPVSSLSTAVVISPLSVIEVEEVRSTSLISVPISSILRVPEPAFKVTSVASSPSPAVPRIGTPIAIAPLLVEIVRSAASARSILPSAPPSTKETLSALVVKVMSVPFRL